MLSLPGQLAAGAVAGMSSSVRRPVARLLMVASGAPRLALFGVLAAVAPVFAGELSPAAAGAK
eukprot:10535125-Lingulodinium_polyedra.AAC.1